MYRFTFESLIIRLYNKVIKYYISFILNNDKKGKIMNIAFLLTPKNEVIYEYLEV